MKRLLLVEDDPNLGMLLQDYLQLKGEFKVVLCKDGEEGLAAFAKEHFDLCILDVMMPKKDGFQVSMEIRALEGEKSRIPIIALTASAFASDRQKCLKFGMDDHISKPIDIDMLEKKLKKILGSE